MKNTSNIKQGKAWIGNGKDWLAAPKPGASLEYIAFYNSKIK
jgi:hypothetical protein